MRAQTTPTLVWCELRRGKKGGHIIRQQLNAMRRSIPSAAEGCDAGAAGDGANGMIDSKRHKGSVGSDSSYHVPPERNSATLPSTPTRPPEAHSLQLADTRHHISPSCGGDEASSFLVVVTGGSKGIGKACVESFARRGARVLFSYCSDVAAASMVEEAYARTGRVQSRKLDQGDFESVQTFATEVDRWREGRKLDAVVNNAALGVATVSNYNGVRPAGGTAAEAGAEPEERGASDKETRRRAEEDVALMRVNALGPMWVTEALLPMMQPCAAVKEATRGSGAVEPGETGSATATTMPAAPAGAAATESGTRSAANSEVDARKHTVMFIGSVGGGSQSVFPGFRAADAMSKAALAYCCKHFAARYGCSSGVDFLCLCPGATLTDMFRASTLDKMSGPAERERFVQALPQGRLMRPEEVGEAVYWFCSCPAASMFNGAVIDGSAGLAVRPGALTEYSCRS